MGELLAGCGDACYCIDRFVFYLRRALRVRVGDIFQDFLFDRAFVSLRQTRYDIFCYKISLAACQIFVQTACCNTYTASYCELNKKVCLLFCAVDKRHLKSLSHSGMCKIFYFYAFVRTVRGSLDLHKVIYLSRLASSIIRRTKSATLIPSRLASACSHFICGSVKSMDRFMGVIYSTLLEPCQGAL